MLPVQFDLDSAKRILDQAISICAQNRFAGDIQTALAALQQGQCDICRQVSDILVTQIGDYLCEFDKTVRMIYKYEPEHVNIRRQQNGSVHAIQKSGINLVAEVERKSAALLALVASLETSLSEARKRLGCKYATDECFILDIHMVDEKDALENRGLGMMVNSTYVRSVPVWKRPNGKNGKEAAVDISQQLDIEKLLSLHDMELVPENALFEQAAAIEQMPGEQRKYYQHHLSEIKVALIRRLISDQLAYINIAKKWFSISDLMDIYRHRIGYGKIGGKSAGMMLAVRIVEESGDEELKKSVFNPESYFIGADTCYIFMAMNGLMHWNDQKYKPDEQIWSDYEKIQEEFQQGEFPPEIVKDLDHLLARVGDKPLIVRSSSQLEDNFGTSFAGKYETYYLPNQGSPAENLAEMKKAIARIYASTLKPEALLYRKSKGLQDYDERMAILIQEIQGEKYGRYYLPFGAGVAFSRNLYRWAPQIRREDGFVRMVWGLGTRAVQRIGDDFPRIVALSHPTLLPDDTPEAIRYYSQQYVDLIDLEENRFCSMSVHEVIEPDYPGLRLLAQIENDGYFGAIRRRVPGDSIRQLAITYNEMLVRTKFAQTLSSLLKLLEMQYRIAVDVEFTISIDELSNPSPEVVISLLQCRPQSYMGACAPVFLPGDLPPEDVLFTTGFMVPHGYLREIKYLLVIKPEAYYCLKTAEERRRLSRVISRVNRAMAEKSYICIGPGRWGTTNHDLGVYVAYTDIDNAGALVELTGRGIGIAPEPSLGTHFFQDLMEARIYPIAINLDESDAVFNQHVIEQSPNRLDNFVHTDGLPSDCLRLVAVEDYRPGSHLEIVMDDEKGKAVAFFTADAA